MKLNIRLEFEDGIWICAVNDNGIRVMSSDMVWIKERNGKFKIKSVNEMYEDFGVLLDPNIRIKKERN